jgi:hypothetical protein
MTHRHICLSVEGALRNWKLKDWKIIAKSNKCSVDDVKESFWQYMREGKIVIPYGPVCEGFDFKKGCPGHKEPEEVLLDPNDGQRK